MQFSSRFTIAVHTMLCIVRYSGEAKVTSTFLAGSVNVNPVIIRNVLGQLKSAGLVRVEAGVGGASIAKDPEDITLLDIFNAVEDGGKELFHFHDAPNPACQVGQIVHTILDDKLAAMKAAVDGVMRSITFQSLIDEMEQELQNRAP